MTPDVRRLPDIVQQIYRLVAELEALAPGRKFTPDGHMVGSLGELWAAHLYDLTLLPNSAPAHDARARDGRLVQIKATQGNGVSTYYAQPEHLLVFKLLKDGTVEEWFNGPGAVAWTALGAKAKNGQHRLSLKRLRALMTDVAPGDRLTRARHTS